MWAALPATAMEYSVRAAYAGEHSDNIRLAPATGAVQSEWIDTARIGFLLRERSSSRLDLRLFSQAEHRDYRRNTFNDDTVLTLNSAATWTVAPQRLDWVVEDYYGQTLIDVTGAPTPDNLQDINVLSLGPDVFWRMSERTHGQVGVRFGNYYTEATDADADRYAAMGAWNYLWSPIVEVSLNYDGLQTAQRHPEVYRDYTRHNLFAGLNRRLPHSRLELRAGQSFIRPDGEGTRTDNYWQALWLRPVTALTDLRVSVLSRAQDAADAVLAATAVASAPPTANVQTYRFDEAAVAYARTRAGIGDRLRLFAQELDYDAPLLDEERLGAELEIGLGLSATATGAVFASFLRSDFVETGLLTRDSVAGVRLQYRMRPRIALGVEGRWSERASSDLSREYTENRALLTIGYNSNPSVSGGGRLEAGVAR